jgi:histidinol phosphatase-like enzyme
MSYLGSPLGLDGQARVARNELSSKTVEPSSRAHERDSFLDTADDVEVLPGRAEILRRYRDAGFRLLGLSWYPEIAEGTAPQKEVEAGHVRMQELLGLEIDVLYCPHGGGPPVCWCRKPMPGLGVVFIQRYRLDAARCVYVGVGGADAAFARRMGFRHEDAEAFFDPARRPSE